MNNYKALITSSIFFASCQAHSAPISYIDIMSDRTNAYASVTYAGPELINPGTTTNNFSGPIFGSGGFNGLRVETTRKAIVTFPDGSTDFSSYTPIADFVQASDGEYRARIAFGYSNSGQYGTFGLSQAEIDMSLTFSVSGGDVDIYMYSELYASKLVARSTLQLFDETIGASVVDLEADSLDVDYASFTLKESHTYTMSGYAYAFTPHSGDPYSYFYFDFGAATVRSVSEPGGLSLMALALAGLAARLRKNV